MANGKNVDLNEVRQILKDIAIRQQEAEKRQKEAEKRQKKEEEKQKANEEMWNKKFEEMRKKADNDWDRTLRRLNAMDGEASKAWGDFSESCIKEGAIKAFNNIGFPVDHYYENEQANYIDKKDPDQITRWEFDLIVFSEKHKIAIVVEVKTTLDRSYINIFVKKLNRFLTFIKDKSKYKGLDKSGQMLVKLLDGKKIYGAVGYVNLHKKEKKDVVIEHAQNKRLLVLSATKDSAKIVTPKDFKPLFQP